MTQLSNPAPGEVSDATKRVYRSWREGFVLPLLIGILVFGAIALFPAISASNSLLVNSIFIGVYALIAVSAVFKFPYAVRISAFLFGIYAVAIGELISLGILGDSLFFFLALIVFSTMLLSPRAGIYAIAAGIATFLVVAPLMLEGYLVALNPNAAPARWEDWLSAAAALLMFGVVIIIGFRQLEREFSAVQEKVAQTLAELRDERNNLETRVEERTLQLRRINEVERAVAAILDAGEILPMATRHIQSEFGFYCTAVYLMDSTGQWAELTEAVGEAGRLMKERKHRLNVNGKSLVAQVIRSKSGQIVQDGSQIRQEYPLFPYTREIGRAHV